MPFDLKAYRDQNKDIYGNADLETVAKHLYYSQGLDKEGFKGPHDFIKKSGLDKQIARYKQEQAQKSPQVGERGLLGDVGSLLARGGARTAELTGHALQTMDPEGGIDLAQSVGERIERGVEQARKDWSILQPDKSEREGEGFFTRGVKSGIEHSVPSLTPALGGAAAGAAATSWIPVPGARVAGALAGSTLATLGLFGAGVYGQSKEEALEKGLPEEEAHKYGLKHALTEGGIEVGSNIIGLLTMGVGRAASQPIKQTAKELLSTPLNTLIKQTAKNAAINEIPTEMLQEGLQAKIDQEYGMSDVSWQEAVKESIIPAMTMSVLFGLGAEGLNTYQRRKVAKQLNSEDPNKRVKAAQEVKANLKSEDEQLAKAWEEMAQSKINNNEVIDLNENFVEFAQRKKHEERSEQYEPPEDLQQETKPENLITGGEETTPEEILTEEDVETIPDEKLQEVLGEEEKPAQKAAQEKPSAEQRLELTGEEVPLEQQVFGTKKEAQKTANQLAKQGKPYKVVQAEQGWSIQPKKTPQKGKPKTQPATAKEKKEEVPAVEVRTKSEEEINKELQDRLQKTQSKVDRLDIDKKIDEFDDAFEEIESSVEEIREQNKPLVEKLKKEKEKLKGKKDKASNQKRREINKQIQNLQAEPQALRAQTEEHIINKNEELAEKVKERLKKRGITDEEKLTNYADDVMQVTTEGRLREQLGPNWADHTVEDIIDKVVPKEAAREKKEAKPAQEVVRPKGKVEPTRLDRFEYVPQEEAYETKKAAQKEANRLTKENKPHKVAKTDQGWILQPVGKQGEIEREETQKVSKRSQSEIDRWRKKLDNQGEQGKERLRNYLASQTMGRDFQEETGKYLERKGLKEFHDWAKLQLEEKETQKSKKEPDYQPSQKVPETEEKVLEVQSIRDIRGKRTDGNWAVDYMIESPLGEGRQTVEKVFQKKKDAQEWIKANKPQVAKKEGPQQVVEGEQGAKAETTGQETKEPGTSEITESDIDFEKARQAFAGTSHTPEDRARSQQSEYVKHMNNVYGELSKLAKSEEQQKVLEQEFNRYKDNYINKFESWLDAHSRVMSPMVAGPSKFPTERNRKRSKTADKRFQELQDFDKKARNAMRRKIKEAAPIEQQESENLERFKRRITENLAIIQQIEQGEIPGMDKGAFKNSISGFLQRATKEHDADFMRNALNHLRQEQERLGITAFTDRHKIWNLPEQAQSKAEEQGIEKPSTVAEFDGALVENVPQDDRVRIHFDDKPDQEIRQELKSNGWKWSRANTAWQRKTTEAAKQNAVQILDKHFERAKPQEEQTVQTTTQKTPQEEKPVNDTWKLTKSEARNKLREINMDLHKRSIQEALELDYPVPRKVLEEYKGEEWADKALQEREKAEQPQKEPTEAEPETKFVQRPLAVPGVRGAKKGEKRKDISALKKEKLSLKEQKDWLLKEISKAQNRLHDYMGYDYLEFNVPGDGQFLVKNSREELNNFKENVEKRFPTKRKKPPQGPKLPSLTSKKRITEGEFYNEFEPHKVPKSEVVVKPHRTQKNYFWDEKNKYYSNTNYLIKLNERPSVKGFEFETYDFSEIFEGIGHFQETEIAGQFSFEREAEGLGDKTYAHIRTWFSEGLTNKEGEYKNFIYPIEYIDAILTEHENAKPHVNKDGILLFKENNKIVGAVMPMQDMSFTNYHLERYKEIYGEDPKELRSEVEGPAYSRATRKDFISSVEEHLPPAYQRAYHGTPYRNIEKFSLEKVGTGEGAQAFGYGLYFTDKQEIADWYRKNLSEHKQVVYDGDKMSSEQFKDNVARPRLVDAFKGIETDYHPETLANLIAFDWTVGYHPEEILSLANKQYRASTGQNLPKKVSDEIEYILDGLERPKQVSEERLGVEVVGGIRNEKKLSNAEQAAIFDINGRMQWLSPKKFSPQEALERVKKDLENTIEVQKERLDDKKFPVSENEKKKIRTLIKECETGLRLINNNVIYPTRLEPPGQVYEVEVPDDSELLNWDKPLSKQPKKVREAIDQSSVKPRIEDTPRNEIENGRDWYKGIATRLGSEEAASRHLNSLGIKGHKYKDASARGTEKESYNYVIYDDNTIEILDAYYSRTSVKPWPENFPNALLHTSMSKLKQHPDHEKAKQGDIEAAYRVVRDLIKPERIKELKKKYPDAIVVAPHAQEAEGKNTLPLALVNHFEDAGFEVDTDIVQSNKAARTKKDSPLRLAVRPEFDGPVQKNQNYIIVDDAIGQGGTISELRHYIENNGGNVVHVSALTSGIYGSKIRPDNEVINKLEEKFGREELENFLQEYNTVGKLEALTNKEARYILKQPSLESLRDRILEAAQEEGISPAAWQEQRPLHRIASQDEISFAFDFQTPEAVNQPILAGLDRKTVKQEIDELVSGLATDYLPKINVHQSESELPKAIQSDMAKRQAEGEVEAAWWNGELHFVSDNIASRERVERALLHELFGHVGPEAILGERANNFYMQVYLDKQKEARKVAQEYNLDLRKRSEKIAAAKEVVARMAEEGVQDKILDRIVKAIKDVLRKAGFRIKMSDAEIRQLIARGKGHLQSRQEAQTGQMRQRMLAQGQPLFQSQKNFTSPNTFDRSNAMTPKRGPGKHSAKHPPQPGSGAGIPTIKNKNSSTGAIYRFDNVRQLIDGLIRLGTNGVFIRWSRGPAYDQKQKYSIDKVSGQKEKGLSAIQIEKEWLDEPWYLVRRLKEYAYGTRLNDPNVRGWIYAGKKLGEDSDGYDAIEIQDTLGVIGKRFLDDIDNGLARFLELQDSIEKDESKLKRLTDKSAIKLTQESLDKNKKEIEKYKERFKDYPLPKLTGLPSEGGTADIRFRRTSTKPIDTSNILSDIEGTAFSRQVPVFYSQMQDVLNNKLPKKGTPGSMKNMIQSFAKKGQFKPEELEWSGLEQWLDEQEGKVTKDQILDYLQANQIQVQEVSKAKVGPQPTMEQVEKLTQWLESNRAEDFEGDIREHVIEARNGNPEAIGDLEMSGVPDELLEPFRNYVGGEAHPRYEQYTLPGGRDYQEFLLTLPSRRQQIAQAGSDFNEGRIGEEEYNRITGGQPLPDSQIEYKSPHWSEPNILAHIRFNERIDSEGNRVLFIEEVQSDWHQWARERGYKRRYQIGDSIPVSNTEATVVDPTRNEKGEILVEYDDGERERISTEHEDMERPPDAPFKTTWPMLAMKRMLRFAAENGYDKVAWTPGEMQADRYDLSKQVGKIVYSKDGTLSAYYKADGPLNRENRAIQEQNVSQDKLSDYIGKEAADRLLNNPSRIIGDDTFVLEGGDLKVGGAGMKAFYDKMLPSMLNKYIKKWGTKVGTTKISDLPLDNTGRPDLQHPDMVPGGRMHQERMAWESGERGMYKEVHAIPVTEKMYRDAVEAGQPLFKRRRAVEQINTSHALPENVRKRMEDARGARADSLLEKAKDVALKLYEQRKSPVEHYLDKTKDAQLIEVLRQHRNVPRYAQRKAWQYLKEILEPVQKYGPKGQEVFSMNLILGDMLKDMQPNAQTGKPLLSEKDGLPFGFESEEQVRKAYNEYKRLAELHPEIEEALNRRNTLMQDLRKRLVDAKILKKSVLNDPVYFHHQVLEYLNAKHGAVSATGSQDVRTHWRGWMAARKGSAQDYNTEYAEAEFEVLSQGIEQLETHNTLQKIKSQYDILPDLRNQAKKENVQQLWDKLKKEDRLEWDNKKQRWKDPLLPFKQKMAMSLSNLRKMAQEGDLEYSDEWRDVVQDLIDGASSIDLGLDHRNAKPHVLNFLSYLVDKKKSGAKWAATALKSIQERNRYMKQELGDNFLKWQDVLKRDYPEHTTWRPKNGTVWYKTFSVADRIIDQIMEQGKADLQAQSLSEVKALIPGEQWVIPQRVADQMDDFKGGVDTGTIGRFSGRILSAWKQWVLMNPWRLTKYNLNNMSGDWDIANAYAPEIWRKYFTKAARDLTKFHYGGEYRDARVKQEMDEALYKDVIDSGMTVYEIEDLNEAIANERYLRDLMAVRKENLVKKAVSKYWNGVKNFTRYRENILRLAAYRFFKDKWRQGYKLYGASNPQMIDQLKTIDDKAARLARELVGDYGNISQAGEYIRRRIIPFWSWLEINAPRYVKLFRNLKDEGRGSRAVGTMTWKGTKLALKASTLYAAISLFNHLVHPDEEDELKEYERRQLHLILGRREDGSIMTLRFQGALSDALSWFGLEDLPHDIQDLTKDKATVEEKLAEAAKAAPKKLITGLRPEPKLLYESLSRRSLYPNPFEGGRPIRDVTEHVLRTFSLEGLYNKLVGKPDKDAAEPWEISFFNDIAKLATYSTDPGEAAYYSAKKMIYDYMDKQGIERPSITPTNRSNALYYYRQALKYGDMEAAAKYKKKYFELGGTYSGISRSLKRAHPLAGLPKRLRFSFRQSLTPRQEETLQRAIKWYRQTYRGY